MRKSDLIGLILLAFVLGCRFSAPLADFYAERCYSVNPDIVLLMLGTNDTKTRNWDPDIFRRDYRKIVESYQNLPSHPRVILIAPIRIHLILGKPLLGVHPDTMEEGIRPAIREIAEETGLELVDLRDLFMDTRYCRDGVHPQKTGARMLAEAIYSSVQW